MHIIIRYGELALKGKNRWVFENRLVRNIKDCFKKNNKKFRGIIKKRGRIYVDTTYRCDELANVFGIVSFSYSTKLPFDIENIKAEIDKQLKNRKFKTFRVSAHRVDKEIKMKSMDINIEIGNHVVEKYEKKVSLTEYDLDIGIEIFGKDAYVYTDRQKGPGGLPYGSTGKAFAMIEDDKSILAAYLMMKRGVRIFPVGKGDISILEKYNYGFDTLVFSEMNKRGITAISSSQTVEEIKDYDSDLLVLRPLVGFTVSEIKQRLKNL